MTQQSRNQGLKRSLSDITGSPKQYEYVYKLVEKGQVREIYLLKV